MCLPFRALADQRPALIACARSINRRSSPASRSAMSMRSRPWRFTEAIMIPRTPNARLKSRFDQLAGDDRSHGQVAHGVELGQAGPEPGIVAEPDDEIAAG